MLRSVWRMWKMLTTPQGMKKHMTVEHKDDEDMQAAGTDHTQEYSRHQESS
jgi:hypothetical protein